MDMIIETVGQPKDPKVPMSQKISGTGKTTTTVTRAKAADDSEK